MTTKVFDCHENDMIEDAVGIMKKSNVSRLIVRNKAGSVTGIVSFGDVIWRGASAEEAATIVKHAVQAYAA